MQYKSYLNASSNLMSLIHNLREILWIKSQF